jgi:hypothetical protein
MKLEENFPGKTNSKLEWRLPFVAGVSVTLWRVKNARTSDICSRLPDRPWKSTSKLQGIEWRNGEAIWRSLMLPEFAVFDMSWLASAPLLAKIMCWSVIAIEAGYVFLYGQQRLGRYG